jgi:hypothetical protein
MQISKYCIRSPYSHCRFSHNFFSVYEVASVDMRSQKKKKKDLLKISNTMRQIIQDIPSFAPAMGGKSVIL